MNDVNTTNFVDLRRNSGETYQISMRGSLNRRQASIFELIKPKISSSWRICGDWASRAVGRLMRASRRSLTFTRITDLTLEMTRRRKKIIRKNNFSIIFTEKMRLHTQKSLNREEREVRFPTVLEGHV